LNQKTVLGGVLRLADLIMALLGAILTMQTVRGMVTMLGMNLNTLVLLWAAQTMLTVRGPSPSQLLKLGAMKLGAMKLGAMKNLQVVSPPFWRATDWFTT
jgi:hypothetical protein